MTRLSLAGHYVTHSGAVQVIAHAPTFSAAVQKMQRALYEFVIRGVKSNMPFLSNVLRHPAFLSGQVGSIRHHVKAACV